MQASYPGAYVNWTDRVNGEIIWAADPNSIAAEVAAIENAIGLNPSVETAVPYGPPQQYANLSARVSTAMLQTNHPYIDLELDEFRVEWQQSTGLNDVDFMHFHPPYRVREDTHGYFDGTCITVRAPGLYLIEQAQHWDYRPRGWCRSACWVDGNIRRQDIFHYDGFPDGSNYYGQTYNGEFGYTHTMHFEVLGTGTRVRTLLGNATDADDLMCIDSSFKAYYLRQM